MLARSIARRFAALGGILALGAALGCPPPQPDEQAPAGADLFERSALPEQIAGIQEDIRGSLALRSPQFTEAQAALAGQIAGARFAPPAIAEQVRARLDAAGESEHLAPTLSWLETPLGLRMIEAVKKSASPAAAEAMRAYVEQKNTNSPSEVRLSLFERYDAATNAPKTMGRLLLLAAFSGNTLLNAVKPDDQRLERDELLAIVDSQNEVLRPLFAEVASIRTQMMLRDFSDADVTAIVLFAESEHGRWYHDVTSMALLDAVEQIAIESEQAFLAALEAPAPS
jgi:hypothetical protein